MIFFYIGVEVQAAVIMYEKLRQNDIKINVNENNTYLSKKTYDQLKKAEVC